MTGIRTGLALVIFVIFQDVLDIFKRGTGEEFDFSKVKHTLEDQE